MPRGSRIAVVGAGVAGLQAARALLECGHVPTVFDAAPAVGGIWRSNYAGYHCQLPIELYQFPDLMIDEWNAAAPPGALASPWRIGMYVPRGEEIQQYVLGFVRATPGLHECLRLGTKVLAVAPAAGGEWDVTSVEAGADLEATPKSKAVRERYAAVIIATGEYNKSYLPEWPGLAGFGGKMIHSSDFTDASVAAGEHVVVVGAGKSSVDVTNEACAAGAASTAIVMRTPRWQISRFVAHIIPVKFVAYSRLAASFMTPAYMQPGGFRAALSEGRILSALGTKEGILWPLTWLYWRIVQLILVMQFAMSWRPPNSFESDLSAFGGQCVDGVFHNLVRDGKVTAHTMSGVARLERDAVVLENGKRLRATLVIAATGFRKEYTALSSVLQELSVQDDGLYLYKQIFCPALPGLAFVGCETLSINNILTSYLQAQLAVAVLTGRKQLPEPETQREEIERHKAAQRKYVKFSHDRASKMTAQMMSYHDALTRELGFNPFRKGNPLREIFEPYTAADYVDVKALNVKPPKDAGGDDKQAAPGTMHMV
jgi:dimethylaniline monooxygenase (N-oxide forming)